MRTAVAGAHLSLALREKKTIAKYRKNRTHERSDTRHEAIRNNAEKSVLHYENTCVRPRKARGLLEVMFNVDTVDRVHGWFLRRIRSTLQITPGTPLGIDFAIHLHETSRLHVLSVARHHSCESSERASEQRNLHMKYEGKTNEYDKYILTCNDDDGYQLFGVRRARVILYISYTINRHVVGHFGHGYGVHWPIEFKSACSLQTSVNLFLSKSSQSSPRRTTNRRYANGMHDVAEPPCTWLEKEEKNKESHVEKEKKISLERSTS